jgi:quercetin dioxygenase-like cupin family protein
MPGHDLVKEKSETRPLGSFQGDRGSMKPNREPMIVRPGEGQDFGDGLHCRVPSAGTGGTYCAFEVVTAPGQGVPLHVHSREDEVLLHTGTAVRDSVRATDLYQADTGAMAVLPRGIPHAFRNRASTPSRALTVFIPGGFDELVAELRQLPP